MPEYFEDVSDDKVTLSLSPFDALNIYAFLSEFEKDMQHPHFSALKKSIDNYKDELAFNLRTEQIEDAKLEREVKKLLNEMPS